MKIITIRYCNFDQYIELSKHFSQFGKVIVFEMDQYSAVVWFTKG